jgi:hypothetical protein
LTAIRTVGQVMSDERAESSLEDADEVPPHIEKKITHDYMDKHYRETLDAPLPALDGKSPRQAVRSAAGRAKVVDWLKLLENRSDKQQNAALAEYDFGWMWEELGLQEYRK